VWHRRAVPADRTLARADDEHFVVELIDQKPGHTIVHSWTVEYVERSGLALLEGIIDRLEPHAHVEPQRGMSRAITGGED